MFDPGVDGAIFSREWKDAFTTRIAADLMLALIKAVPYNIQPVLTDNNRHFTEPSAGTAPLRTHLQALQCDAHDQLHSDRADFVQAYSFAKRLKTFRGLHTDEFICKPWRYSEKASPQSAPPNAGTQHPATTI